MLVAIPLAGLFLVALAVTIVAAVFVLKAKKMPGRRLINKLKIKKRGKIMFAEKLSIKIVVIIFGLILLGACGGRNNGEWSGKISGDVSSG